MAVVVGAARDSHSLFRCLALRLHGDPALAAATRGEAVRHVAASWSASWRRLTGFRDRGDYAAFMSRPSSHGTFAELRAVGELYRCTVAVVRRGRLVACRLARGGRDDAHQDPVVLRLVGRCFELYDSVPPGVVLREDGRLACPPDLETARQQMEAGECRGGQDADDPEDHDGRGATDPWVVLVPIRPASVARTNYRTANGWDDADGASLASAIDVEAAPIKEECPSDPEDAGADACLFATETVRFKEEFPTDPEASAGACVVEAPVETVHIKEECLTDPVVFLGPLTEAETASREAAAVYSITSTADDGVEFTFQYASLDDEVGAGRSVPGPEVPDGEVGADKSVPGPEVPGDGVGADKSVPGPEVPDGGVGADKGVPEPEEPFEYKCCQCPDTFDTKAELERHRPEHGHIKCPHCEWRYKKQRSFKDHVRLKHTGRDRYPCDLCGEAFGTNFRRNYHRRLVHTGEKPYKCDACPRAFVARYELVAHSRRHTGELAFLCDLCPMAFGYPKARKLHMATHNPDKLFKCDVCGKTFVQRQDLRTHALLHTQQRPWACKHCPMRFRGRSLLLMHVRRNHTGTSRTFDCTECSASYVRRQGLDRHRRRAHAGARPFQCDLCPNGYVEERTLRLHQLSAHLGRSPYRCGTCGATFSSAHGVRVHRAAEHAGPKPFQCDKCPMAFAQPMSLRIHWGRRHPGERFRVLHVKDDTAEPASTDAAA